MRQRTSRSVYGATVDPEEIIHGTKSVQVRRRHVKPSSVPAADDEPSELTFSGAPTGGRPTAITVNLASVKIYEPDDVKDYARYVFNGIASLAC